MDKLYLNDYRSDLICYVGESKENAVRFPAHKWVLMLVSPVFEVMLRDDNYVESTSGEVLFTDITPNAFKAFLFFAYMGRLKNHNVTETFDILYVAQKYLIDNLTNACFQRIENEKITIHNFWSFFSIVYHYYNAQFPDEILIKTDKFLNKNATDLLQHEEFENLSHSLLSAFIENGFLKVENELEVFNSVINWAKIECCRQQLDISPRNQRRVLGDIVYKIRYLSMLKEDLINGPIKSKILTTEEGRMLLQKHINDPTYFHYLPAPWNRLLQTEPRKRAFEEMTWRLSETDVPDGTSTDHFWYSTILVADNDLVLQNVDIYVLPEEHKVNLTCTINDLQDTLIREWNFNETFDNDTETEICIQKAVFLKAYTCYKFNVLFRKGAISSKRFKCGVCSDTLCVGGYSYLCREAFKSTQFWKQNLLSFKSTEYFFCLNSNIFSNITVDLIYS